MAKRGTIILKMAIDAAKISDEYEFKSNSGKEIEPYDCTQISYFKSNLKSDPKIELPTDTYDRKQETRKWVSQNKIESSDINMNENESLCEVDNNYQTTEKYISNVDEFIIDENQSNKADSYYSSSIVDDSYIDKNYIPDYDDISSIEIPLQSKLKNFDNESFANENSLLGKGSNLLNDENVYDQTITSFKGKKVSSNIIEEKNNGYQQTLETQDMRWIDNNSATNLYNNNNHTSDEKPISKKIRILSNFLITKNKNSLSEINANKNNFTEDIIQQNTIPTLNLEVSANNSLINILNKKKVTNDKLIHCKFCDGDIANKNFMRHLTRKHNDEMEVINILKLPKCSKERRKAFAMLRNNINFDLYIKGVIKPNRYQEKTKNYNTLYFPCVYCKGIFTKQYLKRHSKSCFVKNTNSKSENRNILARSQTLVACAMDPNTTISKLNVKEKVFDSMKPDKIAFEAKKDLLIASYGESYLKKHKRERMMYSCSNRMRELSRLLIKFREISNDETVSFTDIFHPKHFDNVLFATKRVVGYNHENKTFKTPSLAMHLGTSLKTVCDELTHLILKQSPGFRCKSSEEANIWLRNVKNFRKLVESRWNIEMASLANKELQEKKWNKPLLLPLVSDIKKFRDEVTNLAENAVIKLSSGNEDKQSYKLLCNCTLSLLILFNRRRIGDVQYLKIENYRSEKRSNYTDFENALTEAEKKLTQNYRRILNSGKGSRAVVILIPKDLDKMINLLLKYRNQYILDKENEYLFAMPGSKIKWGKGDVAIRNLCKKIDLENPNAISSNKLRKQIATVTQILNLKPEESKQFSNFMGHTQKTHDEFYELPVDIYQTAKVSKLLLMMEKGTIPLDYKGKSLEEINLDFNVEEVEEDELNINCNDKETVETNDRNPGFYAAEPNITLEKNQNDFTDIENTGYDASSKLMMPQISLNQKTNHNLLGSPSDEKENVSSTRSQEKIKKWQRKGWSNKELHLLKKEFISYINKGCYPSGEDVKLFITKTGMDRSIISIKSKIQHLIHIKNK